MVDLDPRGDLGPFFSRLPMELFDMILDFAEPDGYWPVRTSLIYEDIEDAEGNRGITEPPIPPLAQTSRPFRFLIMKRMFKEKDVYMVHNNIRQSVQVLSSLYPTIRDVIEGVLIHIHDQQTVVDASAGRHLVEILKTMKGLKVICVGGFVEGDWRFQVKYPGETWFNRISQSMRIAQPFEAHYAHRIRLIRFHVGAGGAGKTICYAASKHHPGLVLQRWMENKERGRIVAARAMFLPPS